MQLSIRGMIRQKRKVEDREEEDRLAKKLFGSSAGFPDGFEDSCDDDDEVEETYKTEVARVFVYCITLSRIKCGK